MRVIWAGLAIGFTIFTVNLWLIILILRKAQLLPEEKAPRYIAIRYYVRFAILLVLLGFAVWWWGLKLALGIMAGILLAKIVFLIWGGNKKELFARLLRGEGK